MKNKFGLGIRIGYIAALIAQLLYIVLEPRINNELIDIIGFIIINYLLTGLFLYKAFFKRVRLQYFEQIGFYFILSFVVWSVIAYFGFIFHVPFYLFRVSSFVLNIVLVFLILQNGKNNSEHIIRWNRYDTALVIICLVLCFGVYQFAGFFVYEDIYYHASQIQKIADKGALFTAPNSNLKNTPTSPIYARNSLYAVLAITAATLRYKAIPVLLTFCIFLAPIIVSIYYFFSKTVFKNTAKAFFVTTVFIAIIASFYESPYFYPFKYLTISIYCKWFAVLVLFPAAVSLVLKYISNPATYLVLTVGLSFSIFSTHILYFFYFVFFCSCSTLVAYAAARYKNGGKKIFRNLLKLTIYVICCNSILYHFQYLATKTAENTKTFGLSQIIYDRGNKYCMPSAPISVNDPNTNGTKLTNADVSFVRAQEKFYYRIGKFFILSPSKYSGAICYIAAFFLLIFVFKKQAFTGEFKFLLAYLWFCMFVLTNPILISSISRYHSIAVFERFLHFLYFLVFIPVTANGLYRIGCMWYLQIRQFTKDRISILLATLLMVIVFLIFYAVALFMPNDFKNHFTLLIVIVLLVLAVKKTFINSNNPATSKPPCGSDRIGAIKNYIEKINLITGTGVFMAILSIVACFCTFRAKSSFAFSKYNQNIFQERYLPLKVRYREHEKPYIGFLDTIKEPSVFIGNRSQMYSILSNTRHFCLLWDRMGFGLINEDLKKFFTKSKMGKSEIQRLIEKYDFDYICLDLTQMPEPHYISQNKDLFEVVFRELKMIIIKVNRF